MASEIHSHRIFDGFFVSFSFSSILFQNAVGFSIILTAAAKKIFCFLFHKNGHCLCIHISNLNGLSNEFMATALGLLQMKRQKESNGNNFMCEFIFCYRIYGKVKSLCGFAINFRHDTRYKIENVCR